MSMASIDDWPERDKKWASRYMVAVAHPRVPSEAREERARELISSLHAADVSADVLFGDPVEIAREDVLALGTEDEAVAASEGGGLRQALAYTGTALTFLGASSALVMLTRGVWRTDIGVGQLWVVLGIAAATIAANLAWTLFIAGRARWAIGFGVGGVAVMLACVGVAANADPDRTLFADVPIWMLMIAMVLPGVAVLLVARAVPRRPLRSAWSDDEWLARFRGAMRSRGISEKAAREHERSVRAAAHGDCYGEFGHPVAFARSLAAEDNSAAVRRWRWSTSFGVGVPLMLCVLISFTGSFGAWKEPAMLFLFISSVVTGYMNWRHRPRGQAQ
ncbi:hypothetical protein ACSS7Z_06750 [Microbacterium sp. A82]|uniref:hypothetical protein n=1 Tax=Microbacterium sp. A82 TaxID=3450452 RepID=UPI003F2A87DC